MRENFRLFKSLKNCRCFYNIIEKLGLVRLQKLIHGKPVFEFAKIVRFKHQKARSSTNKISVSFQNTFLVQVLSEISWDDPHDKRNSWIEPMEYSPLIGLSQGKSVKSGNRLAKKMWCSPSSANRNHEFQCETKFYRFNEVKRFTHPRSGKNRC